LLFDARSTLLRDNIAMRNNIHSLLLVFVCFLLFPIMGNAADQSFDGVAEQVIDMGTMIVEQNVNVELWADQRQMHQAQTVIEPIPLAFDTSVPLNALAQNRKTAAE
jgi:hypothetical protein